MRRTAHLLRLLLALRWKTAWRTYARDSSALTGAALALFVFGPAAFAGAGWARGAFAARPGLEATPLLLMVLLAVQIIWVLLLLLPGSSGNAGGGGLAALGQGVPPAVLRAFHVRPWQAVLAAALGALLDLPLLFALPIFGAVYSRFAAQGWWGGLLVAFALAVFALQTVVLAQLFVQAGALLSRRRRSTAWLGLVGALALGVWFGLPSAFAAVTEAGEPEEAWRQRLRPAATEVTVPKAAAPATPLWASLTPAAVTARGISAAAEPAGAPEAAGSLLLSCILALVALAGAARLYHAASVREATSGGAPWRPHSLPASDVGRAAPPGAWAQVRAAAVAEFLNLTRDPAAHTPLRWPAALLFAVFFGWMAPNLDPRFPYENMRDLSGMGGLLYVLLWQTQLLTNRFGNEAGTAGLLFSFPAPRARMLLGRNLALGGLLLLVDGGLVALLCALAGAPLLILPMLLWLPAILLVLTALGNVVSAMSPFPIRKRGERFSAEPERSLAFLYALLGFGAWALLWPVAWALSAAQAAGPVAVAGVALLGAAYVVGLYAATLPLAAGLLERREARTVRILDRDR